MSDPRPIGLFDSGLGGLSIWRAVTSRLPAEATRYLADHGATVGDLSDIAFAAIGIVYGLWALVALGAIA